MIRVATATLVCALAAGCNPVARIAGNANSIRTEAAALADHGRNTNDQTVVRGAERIEDLAADIHTTLPDVEAKTPAWISMIIYLAWAALAIAICVILWQTGIGKAVKLLLGYIPAPIEREAKLLRDVMDPNKDEDLREFVAARRSSSPLFDLAWKKLEAAKKGTDNGDAR
jgi:hypothetical protein